MVNSSPRKFKGWLFWSVSQLVKREISEIETGRYINTRGSTTIFAPGATLGKNEYITGFSEPLTYVDPIIFVCTKIEFTFIIFTVCSLRCLPFLYMCASNPNTVRMELGIAKFT